MSEKEIAQYAGILIALAGSAITYYLASRGNQAKDLRYATRDAIEAQSQEINVLKSRLTEADRQLELCQSEQATMHTEVNELRQLNFQLMHRIIHLEDNN